MPTIQIPNEKFHEGIHQSQKDILAKFDRRDYRFFLLNWHRRARKTTLLLNILIKECCKNPNHVYGYIGPTYKQAKDTIWLDPNMLFSYLPREVVKRVNESALFVEFTNKSVLKIHGSDKPDSIRGGDFAGVGLDEWSLIKPETWTEILRPIIAQDEKRWAIFTFTPKGMNHAYDFWQDSPEWTGWYRSILKASESGIISPDELRQAKEQMPPELYNQEFECSFLADSDSTVIKLDDVLKNVNNSQHDTTVIKKITVADIASEGDDETVIYNLVNTRIESQEIYRHKDLMDTCGRIQANAKQHESNLIAVDQIGEGHGVYSRLMEIYGSDRNMDIYGYDGRVKPRDERTFHNYRAEATWKAGSLFKNRKCDIPNDPVLIKQLSGFLYKYTSAGKILIERKEKIIEKIGSSPDRADAYIMGLDALERAEPVKKPDAYMREEEGEYPFNPNTC